MEYKVEVEFLNGEKIVVDNMENFILGGDTIIITDNNFNKEYPSPKSIKKITIT